MKFLLFLNFLYFLKCENNKIEVINSLEGEIFSSNELVVNVINGFDFPIEIYFLDQNKEGILLVRYFI